MCVCIGCEVIRCEGINDVYYFKSEYFFVFVYVVVFKYCKVFFYSDFFLYLYMNFILFWMGFF